MLIKRTETKCGSIFVFLIGSEVKLSIGSEPIRRGFADG